MLHITIPAVELWDPVKEKFINLKAQTLQLEHSLVSLSKWESKWCTPFLINHAHTLEETIDYVRCMTITQNVNPDIYKYLTDENIEQINDYINARMTAAWFTEEKKGKISSEQVTSETIYHWMIALNIPSEYQKWHLNKLLALIKTCNLKNQPPKKMSTNEILRRNEALNELRKKQLNTTG